jgi:hypothetical protein
VDSTLTRTSAGSKSKVPSYAIHFSSFKMGLRVSDRSFLFRAVCACVTQEHFPYSRVHENLPYSALIFIMLVTSFVSYGTLIKATQKVHQSISV